MKLFLVYSNLSFQNFDLLFVIIGVRIILTCQFRKSDSVVSKIEGGVILSHKSITDNPKIFTSNWTWNIQPHKSRNTLSLSLIFNLQYVLFCSQGILNSSKNESDQRHIWNIFTSYQPFSSNKFDCTNSSVDSISLFGWTCNQRNDNNDKKRKSVIN